MATVITTFTTSDGSFISEQFRSATPKRCKLVTSNLSSELQEEYGVEQLSIDFPFGPVDMKFGNLAAKIDQIQRPGKKPLLEKANEVLRQVSFNAVIAGTAGPEGGRLSHISGTTPVDSSVETIERIAASGATCKFNYGTVQLGFSVVLTKFDYTVKLRDSDGHPVRIDANLTLTEKPVFNQELTNLPVIPIDPPPTPVVEQAEEEYDQNAYQTWSMANSKKDITIENQLDQNEDEEAADDPLMVATYLGDKFENWSEYLFG
tara:strand:- start:1199 stop:1984 length:786 start_codon:yes stop_codon:yes gene_type:complete